ncbi:hypothetical protein MYSE111917_01200 [Mycobacterium senriense]|uniref:Uncharacterized protein n=1 Tax=Mycobacterium senriense TaxID=2775496 RepID=A0ABN6IRD8_9MYCO|nr:hypothetical protein [Mycobacterium senriense]BCZ24744.1 hypothetical protein MTY59_45990 [Mycobacterium senriense]
MNSTPTEMQVGRESLMFHDSNDPRVGGESIWLRDDTEVAVILRSSSRGCTEIAIAHANYYPEFNDLVTGGDFELSSEQARWLATYLLRAAEACGAGSRPDLPGVTRG